VAPSLPDILRKISKPLRRPYVPPEELAYQRVREKGFRPGAIIDVGAYEGNWTRLARRVFPDVPVLMVEPQEAKRPFLEQACSELPGTRYVSALLGRERATREFYEMETGSSVFPERSNVARRSVRLETATLDELAEPMTAPIFLKIDVQGAELEVLEGGQATLARCGLVQLEVALLPYNEGAPAMLEVLSYMDQRDFVPLDVSGLTRPNGVDLAQMDLLFAPRSSPLRRTFFEFGS
jgi:FkbM family methyltransferase